MNKSHFKGFTKPESNYSKLPHDFIDRLPDFETLAEMKVVMYILRHTWGFSEYDKPKKMTTDEFENGRKKRDGTRIDGGTGLAANSIRSGLEKAVQHGFITVDIDDSDKARVEKWYALNMAVDSEIESSSSKIAPRPSKIEERTEKETKERKEHPSTSKTEILATASLEWTLAADEQVTQEQVDAANLKDTAPRMFEAALSFSKPLPWWSTKDWTEFAEWVCAEYAKSKTSFGEYNIWRNTPYTKGGIANTRLRGFPNEFYDSWDMFRMANPDKPTSDNRPTIGV